MEKIVINIPGFKPMDIAVEGEKIDGVKIDPIYDEAGNMIDFSITLEIKAFNGHEILDCVRKRNDLEKIERELKRKMSKKELNSLKYVKDIK